MCVKTDASRMFHESDKGGWFIYAVIRLKIQAYLCKKCCKQQYSKEALSWYNFNPKAIIICSYDDKQNCLAYIYEKW